jgi:hypothetical protein
MPLGHPSLNAAPINTYRMPRPRQSVRGNKAMKTQSIRTSHKAVAAFLAVLGTVMCLGSTVVGYEQVASQAVVEVPVAVALIDAERG